MFNLLLALVIISTPIQDPFKTSDVVIIKELKIYPNEHGIRKLYQVSLSKNRGLLFNNILLLTDDVTYTETFRSFKNNKWALFVICADEIYRVSTIYVLCVKTDKYYSLLINTTMDMEIRINIIKE